jgi:ABC-type phosphate transport system substrate-binding protein
MSRSDEIMKCRIAFVVAFLCLAGSTASWAQVAVVVGSKSTATALNAEQAAALFLGKSDQLPGVGVALLLDQPEASPTRELFYTKVAGKSAAQVKAAWSRLVFSGKGTPPKELSGSAEVKKLVAGNLNAVGYIEKSAVDASVKVLLSED